MGAVAKLADPSGAELNGIALRFRSRWLEGLAVQAGWTWAAPHPAAVQAKADRSPRPASNRVMNQGRGR